MSTQETMGFIAPKPLRLWPGVVIVTAQWLLWAVVPLVSAEFGFVPALAGAAGGLLVLVWWLFFSRARWLERVGAIVLMIVALVGTRFLVHESIAGAGMGMFLYIFAIPGLSLALVAWAVITRWLSTVPRRALLVPAVLLACAPWLALRTAGIFGSSGSEFHWRWTPTPEERLLAQANDEPLIPAPPASLEPAVGKSVDAGAEPTPITASAQPAEASKEPAAGGTLEKPATLAEGSATTSPTMPATPTADPARETIEAPAEWPGFRGPERGGVIRDVRINTDWSASPPVEIWRRPIGPGWSSFAVRGDLLYTQEQRGEDEIVSCYRVSTGEPVWRHRDRVRFYESNGGPGPRATPTIHNGRVYSFGATGILNALDATTGAVAWSRNVTADLKRNVPDWGYSSSPLIVGDVVIVAASGTLAGYDLATGNPRWVGRRQLASYSSPHLATIDRVPQILLLSGSGAAGFAPADGAVLWEHEWKAGGASIVQPALMGGGDILINAIAMTGGSGVRRIAVAHHGSGWQVEERWTSNGLKPYYNDFVIHNGHAFGFDGSILSCIDVADGTRKWKGGRYGNGQLVLLPNQDLLLVISEDGELVLVDATPDQFREITRFRVLNAKTWNHPVIVRDTLLVRNGEEMAAYRLPLVDR